MVVPNLSVLTSVRRIVKIAVRFLHTKTALCDRKDTQSRFAVNAARSIVCVETDDQFDPMDNVLVFQCRTQHCVCRDRSRDDRRGRGVRVSMPHAALCVSRPRAPSLCRRGRHCFNAARSIVCVETRACGEQRAADLGFNAARSIVCVETRSSWRTSSSTSRFQCRTQHCVCRDVLPPNGDESAMSFNAARSIVCVETLCPAALVPRGLRRHFGKTRFFAPFLASADELCPEKWGSHRRCPLCGAGCTVLERRNGGMRLCARAGALSISFSSYDSTRFFLFQ